MALDGYYTLGGSGLKVSRLALGTVTFGTDWGWGTDRETAGSILDRYLDAGGNFLDTADFYTNGTSESWLGEFVSARKLRDRVVIASKFSYNLDPGNPNAGGNSRKNILRAVDGSLRRLRTDYIDLYLLHTWDCLTPAEEVIRTYDDLVRAGKVRYVGLSDVPAWYASRAQAIAEIRGYEPLTALQLEYSLIERSIEHEFVALGTRCDMGIMAWSPLAGGLLSGKYRTSGTEIIGEGRVSVFKDSTSPGFAKLRDPESWRVVAELEAVAKELDRSMAQVAVNWVAHRPGIATVLTAATRLAQLEDNLQALDFTLPAELRERLDAVSAPKLRFPYTFFDNETQAQLTGGAAVRDKPAGYRPVVETSGPPPSLKA